MPLNKYPLTDDQKKRLENDYVYHSPKDDQPERYQYLREAAKFFAIAILQNTPSSREQSVALTLLEQVTFEANAAIARNE